MALDSKDTETPGPVSAEHDHRHQDREGPPCCPLMGDQMSPGPHPLAPETEVPLRCGAVWGGSLKTRAPHTPKQSDLEVAFGECSPLPPARRLPKCGVKMDERPRFKRIPLMTVSHAHKFPNKTQPANPRRGWVLD